MEIFAVLGAVLSGYCLSELNAANRKPQKPAPRRRHVVKAGPAQATVTTPRRRPVDPNLSAWSIEAQEAARKFKG